MKRRYYSIIPVIFLLATLILFFVVKWADRPNAQKNGFRRHFVRDMISPLRASFIQEPLSAVCGMTSSHIYYSMSDPRKCLVTNYNLLQLDSIEVPITLNAHELRGASILIDSPIAKLYLNNLSNILSYEIGGSKIYLTKLVPPIFTRVAQISSETVALRAFDSTRVRQLLEKVDVVNGKIIKQADITKNQNDAGFSSDGLLSYDSFAKSLLFVQFYQNRFFALDTNMNILYIGHTIDTTNKNPVSTRSFIGGNNSGSIMPSVPVTVINSLSTTYLGNLFIISTLQADNEENSSFLNHSVVDVYIIKTGEYVGSFYLPNIERQAVNSFKIFNHILVALYKNHIATFRLNFKYMLNKE